MIHLMRFQSDAFSKAGRAVSRIEELSALDSSSSSVHLHLALRHDAVGQHQSRVRARAASRLPQELRQRLRFLAHLLDARTSGTLMCNLEKCPDCSTGMLAAPPAALP